MQVVRWILLALSPFLAVGIALVLQALLSALIVDQQSAFTFIDASFLSFMPLIAGMSGTLIAQWSLPTHPRLAFGYGTGMLVLIFLGMSLGPMAMGKMMHGLQLPSLLVGIVFARILFRPCLLEPSALKAEVRRATEPPLTSGQ